MKSVHMGGLLYIWYSEEGPGWAAAPPSPLLAVPIVTAHAPINSHCINHSVAVRYSAVLMCPLTLGYIQHGVRRWTRKDGVKLSARLSALRCANDDDDDDDDTC